LTFVSGDDNDGEDRDESTLVGNSGDVIDAAVVNSVGESVLRRENEELRRSKNDVGEYDVEDLGVVRPSSEVGDSTNGSSGAKSDPDDDLGEDIFGSVSNNFSSFKSSANVLRFDCSEFKESDSS
jgi:hypothetical protein